MTGHEKRQRFLRGLSNLITFLGSTIIIVSWFWIILGDHGLTGTEMLVMMLISLIIGSAIAVVSDLIDLFIDD